MCDTCSVHIPGPGEVAGGALEAAVGAAISKPGRQVMFWGITVPCVAAIIVYTLGWWLVPIALGLLAAAAGVLLIVRRILRGRTVHAWPDPTPQMRAQLAARGLRPVPALTGERPALPRSIALPRGLSAGRKRKALPVAAKALPAAVITGKVLEEPAIGWENVPAAYKRQVFGQAPRAGR